MIPARIIEYLESRGVSYRKVPHRRAVSAQDLAHTVHVPGQHVAKTVMVMADGQPWIAVLPASEAIQTWRLGEALGADQVWMMSEVEFARLFPDCEMGAEPPFGTLYGLPVVVDRRLADSQTILFRAGSHEEAIEMSYDDFISLEHPRVDEFGTAIHPSWRTEELFP